MKKTKTKILLIWKMRVFLFRAGTDLTTLDNNGRTPLQLAQVNTICHAIGQRYQSIVVTF